MYLHGFYCCRSKHEAHPTHRLKQAGCVGSSENEDGDELIMQVTGATATVLCFETENICDQGTISHDGKTIKWTSGESYTKQIVRELITWIIPWRK